MRDMNKHLLIVLGFSIVLSACSALPRELDRAADRLADATLRAPSAEPRPTDPVATPTARPSPTWSSTSASILPDEVSISLSPAVWLGGNYYRVSGATTVSALAPGAVVRVEFYTAPTGTGMTPRLESADTDGRDGWSWYWQTPLPGSHLWAEAIYADGRRNSSAYLMITASEGEPPAWQTYANADLGYSLEYPSNWQVDEYGLSQLSKEVLFSPPDPEPFIAYFSISLDGRTLEQIQQSYAEQFPNVSPEWIGFAGQRALQYRFSETRFERYVPLHHGVVRFASDRATLPEVQHMLSSFRVIVPIGTVPPPTPACETHTASVQVLPSAQSVQIGQQLIVRVILLNQGCVALGLPKYTLRAHAPQGQPLFNPPQPESVTHGWAVAPGQSDSVEFVLQGAQVGSGALQADVSFEVHIGYPGPAYWGYASSGPINIAVTGNHKPPDSDRPAAGICAEVVDGIASITIGSDAPSPRCVKVTSNVRLRFVNATGAAVQVRLWSFDAQIAPGGEQIIDAPVGSYLMPGVHFIEGIGAEVWLVGS